MIHFIKVLAKKVLPHPFLAAFKRYVYYGVPDALDFLLRRQEEFVPPRSRIFIGGLLFKEIGDEFFGYFSRFGGVKPHHHILDVGCGIGRMARPFIRFLGPEGRFEGFDIDRSGIDWCQKNISTKVPNFRFQVADVYNKYYNPSGKYTAAKYKFPYPDNSFDLIFATSVFTHMFMADIENYLMEISRVMKPGGKCLLSFLIWNAESEKLILGGKSTIPMEAMGDCWVKEKATPEAAICFRESQIVAGFNRAGLTLNGPIHYGNWCGRTDFLSYQDLVIATK